MQGCGSGSFCFSALQGVRDLWKFILKYHWISYVLNADSYWRSVEIGRRTGRCRLLIVNVSFERFITWWASAVVVYLVQLFTSRDPSVMAVC